MKKKCYTHLSHEERETLSLGLAQGHSIGAFAELGYHLLCAGDLPPHQVGLFLEQKGVMTKDTIITLAKELKRKNPPTEPSTILITQMRQRDCPYRRDGFRFGRVSGHCASADDNVGR